MPDLIQKSGESVAEAHQLSAIHPQAEVIFRGFCAPYSPEEIARLGQKLAETAEWLTAYVLVKTGPHTELGGLLCARARHLLESHDSLPPEHQQLVVGAVRYFLFRLDERPDRRGLEGYQDDRIIINWVLLTLGRPDLLVISPSKQSSSSVPEPNRGEDTGTGCRVKPRITERFRQWKRRRMAAKAGTLSIK